MRCMQSYADCLAEMGRFRESVDVFEEMIILNPNDNQGVRDQLLIYLTRINEFNKFRKYDKMYKDDFSACMSFNRALFAFKTEGSSPNSNRLLEKAITSNKHVVPMMTAISIKVEMPEVYGFGDENEAKYYIYFAHKIWHETDGALDWIKGKSKKSRLKIVK
jgi:pentatricopeptide repeat protein